MTDKAGSGAEAGSGAAKIKECETAELCWPERGSVILTKRRIRASFRGLAGRPLRQKSFFAIFAK